MYMQLGSFTIHSEEIDDLHADLSSLSVLFRKVGWQTLHFAPETPPGLPGIPSPRTERIYKMRLVGYKYANRTMLYPEGMRMLYQDTQEGTRLTFDGYMGYEDEDDADM